MESTSLDHLPERNPKEWVMYDENQVEIRRNKDLSALFRGKTPSKFVVMKNHSK